MIAKKPTILIYTNSPDAKSLKEICAGIEEESVFFEVIERDADVLEKLAFDASEESMLGSGIGVKNKAVALHIKGLPRGKVIESYNDPTSEQCRKLGTNSASIIKKKPLKI